MAEGKSHAIGTAWQAFGMIAIVKKNYDEATADFQKGVDANSRSVMMVRLGARDAGANKNDEAFSWFDKGRTIRMFPPR